MFFRGYFGRFKKKNRNVIQIPVIQKGKTFQFRADANQTNKIQDLTNQLGHSESKVIRDIINDFFLDKEAEEWRKEAINL